ncbi:MAG: hypothetical protein VCF07_17115 [Nitrospinota bacterium]
MDIGQAGAGLPEIEGRLHPGEPDDGVHLDLRAEAGRSVPNEEAQRPLGALADVLFGHGFFQLPGDVDGVRERAAEVGAALLEKCLVEMDVALDKGGQDGRARQVHLGGSLRRPGIGPHRDECTVPDTEIGEGAVGVHPRALENGLIRHGRLPVVRFSGFMGRRSAPRKKNAPPPRRNIPETRMIYHPPLPVGDQGWPGAGVVSRP